MHNINWALFREVDTSKNRKRKFLFILFTSGWRWWVWICVVLSVDIVFLITLDNALDSYEQHITLF